MNDEERGASRGRRKGLVIVNTGNGKGKTTAALGVILRAWGRGLRVCVIQFLKPDGARFGEVRAAAKLGIEWIGTGTGFTWREKVPGQAEASAREGWMLAQGKIAGGEYDIILLDEFTYPLHFGWLGTEEVIAWLSENKPPAMHLIITGRHAPEKLIEFADLVTEMREIKHPLAEQQIRAQPGIEF
jgi:cob(I)alamin adenosyltransferase